MAQQEFHLTDQQISWLIAGLDDRASALRDLIEWVEPSAYSSAAHEADLQGVLELTSLLYQAKGVTLTCPSS